MMSGLDGLVPDQLQDGYRLAVPRGWFEDLDEETRAAWERVSAGLPEIDFPGFGEFGKPGITILSGEAAQLHRERVEKHPDKFGKDVLANLQRGLEVKATEHLQALGDRAALADD